MSHNYLHRESSLVILLWNSNGILNRRNELELTMNTNRIDVVLLTETHLLSRYNLYFPNYVTYRSDHPDQTGHGGTAIIIKRTLTHHLIPTQNTPSLQSTSISLQCSYFQFTISAVYCPPNFRISSADFSNFFATLGPRFIAGGDYNSKHYQWGSRVNNPRGRQLLSCLANDNLQFLAPNEHTYWPTDPNRQSDLLDFFITKNTNFYSHIECLYELASDHCSVLLSCGTSPILTPPPPSLTKGIVNWDNFRSYLEDNLNLQIPLKSQNDIENAVEHFVVSIQQAAWDSAVTTNNFHKFPMYPSYIRNLVREKRRARKTWQMSRRPLDKAVYNRLNNQLKRLIKTFKISNFNSYVSSLNTADGSLWTATRRILKHHSISPPLRDSNGQWVLTAEAKSSLFASHLSKVFQPHEGIANNEHISEVRDQLQTPLQLQLPPKYFRPSETWQQIRKLPLKKSPGYDLISAEVLREIPRKAVVFLTSLFNSILRTTKFPIQWKFSVIKMIHKPGKPPNDPASYRPISLLPLCSKLFEKLLYKRLMPIIYDEKILPDHQFGFRSRHSTIHQLHRVVDFLASALERKEFATAIFFDISQAFDRVWHDGLLVKLRFLPPEYYLILKSFLSDRYFTVCQGSSYSNYFPVLAGVPQGSILAPLLYSIYTSDIPLSPDTLLASYADDTVILSSSRCSAQASNVLQQHVHHLENWFTNWRIKLNETKTNYITFTLRKGTCPPIFLNNVEIPRCTSVRYLGLYIDKRLTWNTHVDTKRKTLDDRFKQLFRLMSRRSKLPTTSKLILYKYLLRPIWMYGGQIYGCAKPSVLARIQRFQSKTLRTIIDAPFYVSNKTIHDDLRIPYINDVFFKIYKRFRDKATNHSNPLIRRLASVHLPDNPIRRLRRRWSRDMLIGAQN